MTHVYEMKAAQHQAGIEFLKVGEISLHHWNVDYGNGLHQDGVALTDGRETVIVRLHDLFHLGSGLLAEWERLRKASEPHESTKK